MRYFLTLILISSLFLNQSCGQDDPAQGSEFTEADTLRGMLRPERTCFDVTKYVLDININPEERFINGSVDIFFDVVEDFKTLQLDLYENMRINSIIWNEERLDFDRKYNAVFVHFPKTQSKGKTASIRVNYEGNPTIAKKAPWDGGFVFSKDKKGKEWIGIACEGDGASLWWPNKDHLSDEPNEMLIKCTVPKHLMCVANGKLIDKQSPNTSSMTYTWQVSYPINNYNVSLNIADYVHFSDTFISKIDGEKLPMDFYVLHENEKKARRQFAQVQGVLEAFEYYFGKYPFWEDGYAMVETPYLGMEHQGAIAYGNKYLNGYLGLGGMNSKYIQADYIIVHETGHEYFGNSISCNDHAEMWIHESFTTYMETLYVEYHYGKSKADWYLKTQRKNISNREPMHGPMNVNWDDWISSDHYFKGAHMLNTLRNIVNDDKLWFKTLKALHEENKISHMSTDDVVSFLSEKLDKDLSRFFEQYLYHPLPPLLHCRFRESRKGLEVAYKWEADVKDFVMPVEIGEKGNFDRVEASSEEWKIIKYKELTKDNFRINTDGFYIKVKR